MNEQLAQIYGYLHGMWRYRWSALLIAWIVALLGWITVFSLPDQFTARTVVYVDTSSVLKPLLKGLAPETDTRDTLRIMTRILLSRDNLMSVARESDMDLEITTTAEKEKLLKKLTDAITINGRSGGGRGASNNVYEITYENNSANRAYKVVSSLLNTMIEDTLNSTRTDTASAQDFLDSQIAIYEQKLSLAEQKLADFKKANVGYMPDERGGYYVRLQRAQEDVEKTSSELRLAQRRVAELTRQLKGENPVLGIDRYQSEHVKKLQQYQEQLTTLLNQYTEQHPDVRALRSMIAELKKNSSPDPVYAQSDADSEEFNPVYQEIRVELSKASVEVETLKIKLKEQQDQVNKLRASMDIIPEVEAKLAQLNRGYEVTRKRYLSLVDRKESAQLAQNAGKSTSDIAFRVIEPPIVPQVPSGPNRPLFLAIVLLAALGAGLAWSFARYMLQPTFLDLAQLSTITERPILGSVSLYLSPEHRRKRRLQLSSFVSATFMLFIAFGAVLLLREPATALFTSIIKWNLT